MSALLLVLALVQAPASPNGRDASFQRAVAQAFQRAHGELVKSTDLWVDHTRWENPWIAETEHYEVRTTDSHFLAAEMGRNLEYMRGEFVKLLGDTPPRAQKNRVWIFPDLAAYNTFGTTNGAEHSSMYGSFYSAQHPEQPVAAYFVPNRTQLGMWLTHSAFHQFLEQGFANQPPLWISEGLASYFALFWDWSYGARELERLKRGSSYVALEQMMRAPIQAYVAATEDRFVELGMFFRYLLDYRDDTKSRANEDGTIEAPMRDALSALVHGQADENAPLFRALRQDFQQVEAAFKACEFKAP